MKTRQALKNIFRQGAIPQEQDYHDLLDSYRHISDPIPQSAITGLETTLQGLSNPTPTEHTHTPSEVTGLEQSLLDIDTDISSLQTALAGKAAASHTHADLESAISGKAAASHQHTLSDITDYTAPASVEVTPVLTSGTKIATIGSTDIYAPAQSGWSNPETKTQQVTTTGTSSGCFGIGTLDRSKKNYLFIKADGNPIAVTANANKQTKGWQMVYAFFTAGCDNVSFTLTNFTKIGNFATVQGKQYVLRLVVVNLLGSSNGEFAMAWLDACNCDTEDTSAS